jgi:hypothetical protein
VDGGSRQWLGVSGNGSKAWSVRGGREVRVGFSSRSTYGMRTAGPRGATSCRWHPAGMRGGWRGFYSSVLLTWFELKEKI